MIYVGTKAKSIIRKAKYNDVIATEFLRNSIKAYAKNAGYMAEKLPFHSKFLKYVSGIDPIAMHTKSETTLRYLLELPKHVNKILQDSDTFERKCRKILIDVQLPPCLVNHSATSLDHWWYSIRKGYLVLSEFSLALLTKFHGLPVKSSFNMMGDMIDKKSCKMKVETHSSIQTVKYAMMAKAIQPQIDLQVFSKEKQTKQSFASPVT